MISFSPVEHTRETLSNVCMSTEYPHCSSLPSALYADRAASQAENVGLCVVLGAWLQAGLLCTSSFKVRPRQHFGALTGSNWAPIRQKCTYTSLHAWPELQGLCGRSVEDVAASYRSLQQIRSWAVWSRASDRFTASTANDTSAVKQSTASEEQGTPGKPSSPDQGLFGRNRAGDIPTGCRDCNRRPSGAPRVAHASWERTAYDRSSLTKPPLSQQSSG